MDTKLSLAQCSVLSGFPEHGLTADQVYELIRNDCEWVTSRMPYGIRGKPDMTPETLATETWSRVSRLNPNNGGIHAHRKQTYSNRQSPWARFRDREGEVIEQMADLLGRKFDDISGYIISGSTEGNIMGLWSARNRLRSETGSNSPAAILVARTAHFSVFKAADLLGFENVAENIPSRATNNIVTTINLDENYRLCVKSLKERIERLTLIGYRAFIVIATVGYTVTGAVDQVSNICDILQIVRQRHKIFTALHVDAAFGGIVAPFVEDLIIQSSMNWGIMPDVDSFTLDFHKMGGLPYGCGVYLAKRDSFYHISRGAGYTASRVDATLLGSRSGAMAMALWATIRHKGRQGFVSDVVHARNLTLKAAARLNQIPKLSIIASGLNHLGLCLDSADPIALTVHEFLENEAIFGEMIQRDESTPARFVYPLYFMPDMSEADIDDFLNRLEHVIYGMSQPNSNRRRGTSP